MRQHPPIACLLPLKLPPVATPALTPAPLSRPVPKTLRSLSLWAGAQLARGGRRRREEREARPARGVQGQLDRWSQGRCRTNLEPAPADARLRMTARPPLCKPRSRPLHWPRARNQRSRMRSCNRPRQGRPGPAHGIRWEQMNQTGTKTERVDQPVQRGTWCQPQGQRPHPQFPHLQLCRRDQHAPRAMRSPEDRRSRRDPP
jgi:hypothetical protein